MCLSRREKQMGGFYHLNAVQIEKIKLQLIKEIIYFN